MYDFIWSGMELMLVKVSSSLQKGVKLCRQTNLEALKLILINPIPTNYEYSGNLIVRTPMIRTYVFVRMLSPVPIFFLL